MKMNMIFTHNTCQNPHIHTVTNLSYQIPAPYLNFSFQYRISILRTPNKMHMQLMNTMATLSYILHPTNLFRFVETKVLH